MGCECQKHDKVTSGIWHGWTRKDPTRPLWCYPLHWAPSQLLSSGACSRHKVGVPSKVGAQKKYLHAWRRWLCGFAQARFSAKHKEPVVERWTQVTVTFLLPSPALEEPLPALLPWESLGSYWHIEGSEEACSRPAALKLAIVGWLVLCGTSVLALRLGLRRTQPLNTFRGLRNQRGKPLLS